MKRLIKEEKGTVVVLVAFSMVFILGLLALVLDGGMLYLQKQQIQKAVDHAAHAGMQNLPNTPDKAISAALYVATENGLATNEVQAVTEGGHMILRVDATRNVTFTFAKVLGFTESAVKASATAQLGALTSSKGAIPLGVEASYPLAYGTQVTLKVGPAGAKGSFGAVILSGSGASEYQNDLSYGYSGVLSVNQILPIQTGNIAGPTQKAIQYRFSLCPWKGRATYTDHPVDCPLVVLVPVYTNQAHDTNNVKIAGFASFFLEKIGPINEGSPITGRFLRYVYPGEFSPSLPSFGAYAYKLVK